MRVGVQILSHLPLPLFVLESYILVIRAQCIDTWSFTSYGPLPLPSCFFHLPIHPHPEHRHTRAQNPMPVDRSPRYHHGPFNTLHAGCVAARHTVITASRTECASSPCSSSSCSSSSFIFHRTGHCSGCRFAGTFASSDDRDGRSSPKSVPKMAVPGCAVCRVL